jgi:hypothetical protein
MPIRYSIDPVQGLLVSEFRGEVSPEDLLAWYGELRGRTDFDPECMQIADFRLNVPSRWSPDEMQEVLAQEPFAPTARRAFVGPTDIVYGLARMYSTLGEALGKGGIIRVFREMDEAREWLGLGPEEDS